MTAKQKVIPRDTRIILLDETKYWDEKYLKEMGVEKVFGLYFYDYNSVTHLCSLSGSYLLYSVQVHTVPRIEDDEKWDSFEREYFLNTYESNYYDERSLDRVELLDSEFSIAKHEMKECQWKEGWDVNRELSDEEWEEEVREDLCANHRL